MDLVDVLHWACGVQWQVQTWADVGRGGGGNFLWHDLTHASCSTPPTLLAAIVAAALTSHVPILPCSCLIHVRCLLSVDVSYYPFIIFLLETLGYPPRGMYPSGVWVRVGSWTPRGLPLSFPTGNSGAFCGVWPDPLTIHNIQSH